LKNEDKGGRLRENERGETEQIRMYKGEVKESRRKMMKEEKEDEKINFAPKALSRLDLLLFFYPCLEIRVSVPSLSKLPFNLFLNSVYICVAPATSALTCASSDTKKQQQHDEQTNRTPHTSTSLETNWS
jgi:hypothetical protein